MEPYGYIAVQLLDGTVLPDLPDKEEADAVIQA